MWDVSMAWADRIGFSNCQQGALQLRHAHASATVLTSVTLHWPRELTATACKESNTKLSLLIRSKSNFKPKTDEFCYQIFGGIHVFIDHIPIFVVKLSLWEYLGHTDQFFRIKTKANAPHLVGISRGTCVEVQLPGGRCTGWETTSARVTQPGSCYFVTPKDFNTKKLNHELLVESRQISKGAQRQATDVTIWCTLPLHFF